MLHSSVVRFSMGVPVSAKRTCAGMLLPSCATLVVGLLMYWVSSSTTRASFRCASSSTSRRTRSCEATRSSCSSASWMIFLRADCALRVYPTNVRNALLWQGMSGYHPKSSSCSGNMRIAGQPPGAWGAHRVTDFSCWVLAACSVVWKAGMLVRRSTFRAGNPESALLRRGARRLGCEPDLPA